MKIEIAFFKNGGGESQNIMQLISIEFIVLLLLQLLNNFFKTF